MKSVILITENTSPPETGLAFSAEYEEMLGRAPDAYDFPDLDENTKATIFYTTGTTGKPKCVHYTHRQLVLHTLSVGLAYGAYETWKFVRLLNRNEEDDGT